MFSVSFDDSPAHYAKSSALFSIAYDGVEGSDGVEKAQAEIRSLLEPYDIYAYSMDLKSYSRQLAEEMVGVIAIAAVVIVLILLFTSRSYFEVIIFMIVFVFAALLNMGTNFWLGEISTITNSIAVILQLALAIDYAIIFAHRYQDECLQFETAREALRLAGTKLPIKTKIVSKADLEGGAK